MTQEKKIKTFVWNSRAWCAFMLIVSVVMAFPGCASSNRGVRLHIEKKDGTEIDSELLDVRGRMLIMNYGAMSTVDIADIKKIRVRNKSAVVAGTGVGLLAGITLGVVGAYTNSSGEGPRGSSGAPILGLIGGVFGMGLGALVTAGTGEDDIYHLNGMSEKELEKILRKLKRKSRAW